MSGRDDPSGERSGACARRDRDGDPLAALHETLFHEPVQRRSRDRVAVADDLPAGGRISHDRRTVTLALVLRIGDLLDLGLEAW